MSFFKKIVITILILEAKLILKKYRPFVIAVTGSVGKTTTKDALYDVVRQRGGYVRKSEKSLNSEIGLPLTIIGVPNAWRNMKGWIENIQSGLKLILGKHTYPDTLILEVGADHPGDISNIAQWLKPDVVVITRVGSTPVHVEFFSSPEQVFEEKASLAKYMKKGGTLILFTDEPKVLTIADMVKEKNLKVMTFGMDEKASIRGTNYRVQGDSGPTGFSFDLVTAEKTTPLSVAGIVGTTYMYPLLAASAVGIACGMDMPRIIQGLREYQPPKGRMNIIPAINGATLIDDTYNSSPDAVLAALSALKDMNCTESRIAVLADMMELGKYSAEQHRIVGAAVVGSAQRLVTVGQRSRATADEAIKHGMSSDMVHMCDTAFEAGEFLKGIVASGDIILVKGSQSMRMERVSSALLRDPSKAPEVLVRQEKEWLEKK
ncbi:MAG: UDP-N-acetylmuramoyl-tripeptide--D-alanyl-D-alanine ligase [Candidatus Taylorbacteria bacterium]